jgi:hypothetical protein
MKNSIFVSILWLALLWINGCVDQTNQEVEGSNKNNIESVLENEQSIEDKQVIEDSNEKLIDELVEEGIGKTEEQNPKLNEEKQQAQGMIKHNPNLIAYFNFDDDADDVLNDFTGDIKGGAEFRKGRLGNALYFDGIDDYVELSEEALDSLGKLKQGTIAFWLNFDSILNKQAIMPIFYTGIQDIPVSKDNMFIIEIGHAAGTEDFSQGGRFPPGTPDPENKRIYATWIKDGEEPFLCSDSEVNIVDNQWQHFAVVSGEDGNTLYLNGEEVRNRDYNFGHSTDKAFLEDIPVKEIMTIGYGRSHTWISPEFVYFKGLLDDFRIYDKPLTKEEISNLYSKSE